MTEKHVAGAERAPERVTLDFVRGSEPQVDKQHMKLFIVAGVTKEGCETCFPAYYLNEYPLNYDETCEERGCTHPENDDGCPTTGWFYDESNWEYENCYHAVSGGVVAWAPWPDRKAVHASLGADLSRAPALAEEWNAAIEAAAMMAIRTANELSIKEHNRATELHEKKDYLFRDMHTCMSNTARDLAWALPEAIRSLARTALSSTPAAKEK